MRAANSKEFDTWLDALIAATAEGDQPSSVKLGLVAAELAVLQALDGPPASEEETADLKRVR